MQVKTNEFLKKNNFLCVVVNKFSNLDYTVNTAGDNSVVSTNTTS